LIFLLDTDTCSAHMRRPARLAHRFIQYTGQLGAATVTLAELYAGAYKHSQVSRLLILIRDLLLEVRVLDFDSVCAEWKPKRTTANSCRDLRNSKGPLGGSQRGHW
jgi:tRNA(fMet)-specific endonuclease VapC